MTEGDSVGERRAAVIADRDAVHGELRAADAELRIDNPLHPEFWMSVPLPELLQHVPEELIRDELERRDRKRAKSTH